MIHIDNRLHYARWSDGEVDIVNTLSNECVEIKWSDLVVKDARKLKSFMPNKAARIDGLVKYTLNLVARLNVFALTSTR
jgi:hypothetical protein